MCVYRIVPHKRRLEIGKCYSSPTDHNGYVESIRSIVHRVYDAVLVVLGAAALSALKRKREHTNAHSIAGNEPGAQHDLHPCTTSQIRHHHASESPPKARPVFPPVRRPQFYSDALYPAVRMFIIQFHLSRP